MDKVYVGLDLGSSSFQQAAINRDGAVTMNRRFPTSEANLRTAFAGLRGEIQVHLEAGELAPWAAAVIAPLVKRVVCSHPKDNAWIDLDPSFGDAVAGRTYTKADQVLAELPESLFHHVTIRVRVEEHAILLTGQDESRPSSREVLRYSARAADLAGPDLVLVHQPENWTGPTRLALQ